MSEEISSVYILLTPIEVNNLLYCDISTNIVTRVLLQIGFEIYNSN